ncbi:MAG: hypothetical protein J0H74_25715 [Chitinophagaceae bacterium]|nr:hypothetical protein [Chitinophagaceae bacterium]
MILLPVRKIHILCFLPALALFSCSIPDRPVSKEEALALAHRIERSVIQHDNSVLNRIFDEKAFAGRVAKAGGFFFKKELIQGVIEGLHKREFGKEILGALGDSGSYELIKQYEKDHKQHILFRLYSDGSVNYHDFELIKREDESVRAADLFVYLSGEDLSKTIADALQQVNTDISKEELEKLNTVNTIKSLVAEKDYEKAGQYYDQLPASIKKGKAFQIIHVTICANLGNEKYLQAINEYRSLYPHDPNMYLMMVDAYTLQQNYPMALESVNKLDSLIDKDPYQDYQRGLLYLLMKDTVRALGYFEQLHKNMPAFRQGTMLLNRLKKIRDDEGPQHRP